MAGLGGQPKISIEQQNDVLHTLLPCLISGERFFERQECMDDETVAALVAQLRDCLAEMRMLILDSEDGHCRLSALDPEELAFQVEYLTKEVGSLVDKIRDALAQARMRGR